MKKLSLFVVFLLTINIVYSQGTGSTSLYQKGLSAEQNLNAIRNLTPYSTGGVGFDNRYEGTKGSTRLYDTLLLSFLKIKGQNYYLELKTDIDLVGNTLLYLHPKTGKLLALPADMVSEVVINSEGKELVFRTGGKNFNKDFKTQKFYQVLKDGPFPFIKVPVKKFIEANYKGAYSAGRPYDEYVSKSTYYIFGPDSTFHQLQLNKKSLVRIFPEKKELISKIIDSGTFKNDEDMVIAVLEKF
jgi:hypothetical protein